MFWAVFWAGARVRRCCCFAVSLGLAVNSNDFQLWLGLVID